MLVQPFLGGASRNQAGVTGMAKACAPAAIYKGSLPRQENAPGIAAALAFPKQGSAK
jgi:hypothetical protein